MSENTQSTAAPPAQGKPRKQKVFLKWDAPASETNPGWTSDRSLRAHVRTLKEGGRTTASLAAELGCNEGVIFAHLRKPDVAVGPATPAVPGQPDPIPAAAPPAAVAVPLPVGRGAGEAGGVGPGGPGTNADWSRARDLLADVDTDDLAEFFSAYGLTDRFDGFRTGLHRGRNATA